MGEVGELIGSSSENSSGSGSPQMIESREVKTGKPRSKRNMQAHDGYQNHI
jgi:hypothetical protein